MANYITFFLNSKGERMRKDTFIGICKLCKNNAKAVKYKAEQLGYAYSDVMTYSLEANIAFNTPRH